MLSTCRDILELTNKLKTLLNIIKICLNLVIINADDNLTR